jgi:sulfonate transport system ATP-binding protein
MAPLLELSIRDKSFQGQQILKEVGLQIRQGEIVSVVGPSGCGKSTLLRMICGLDRDYRGNVRVAGSAPDLRSRNVGLIFQEHRLLPWLTVADNVAFDLGRRGGAHPRVRDLLAEVGLLDCADAYPKQLSGGMAQRAAIARGLFTQPALLLLDEPFSSVDALTRMRLQDLLLSVASRHGTTLLLITHDITEAAYLSDRVIVLSGRPGHIRAEICVELPRDRQRRSPQLASVEARILALFETEALEPSSN